ncbi:MAG: hypothetical protein HND52_20000 [Ignavibacteriae bacterium]|nr:hypothetical protein [Ignavibacteriota bacterium]
MKTIIALVLSGLIFNSCSSTYYVQQNDPENNIEKINNLSRTYSPLVKFVDGTEIYPSSLNIKNDSLYVLTNGYETFPLEMVSSISLRDAARGFFDGVFMGIPVAILTCVIFASATDKGSAGDFRGLVILLYSGVAYAVTVAVNTIFGGNKTFVFEREIDNSFSRID